MYQKVKIDGGPDSVHLDSWPDFKEKGARSSERGVLESMKLVREIVEKGLSLRNGANIKVRQPLASFTLEKSNTELGSEYLAIIADELNVKEVKVGEKYDLDTEITPELKAEGVMRDIVRSIQDTRKKENWQTVDKGKLLLAERLKDTLTPFEDEMKRVAGIIEIRYGEVEGEFELRKT